MQSCEVRHWQTFLQLRKKYVYIYIWCGNIWQVKFFSAGKNIHVVVNHEDLAGGALWKRFFLQKNIVHQFSSYFLFDGEQEIKSRALCTNSIQWITKEVGFARIRCDSAWSRKIHFSCFRTLRMEKPRNALIYFLNTIGWNYRKIGYFTKEYGSFLHIPLSKQTEQILAGPLVTPVLSPDPSVVDTFLSASTHDPSKKKMRWLFLREYESGFQMDGSRSCTYHGKSMWKSIWKSCCFLVLKPHWKVSWTLLGWP